MGVSCTQVSAGSEVLLGVSSDLVGAETPLLSPTMTTSEFNVVTYPSRHRLTPSLPRLLDDVDMAFYAMIRGCEFGTTRQPAPQSLEPSWGGGLTRRMNVTAGLMLPSDTPIHVICGSKDVIHSWAIPGLLIKIDCIPGYNAHRRLLIR